MKNSTSTIVLAVLGLLVACFVLWNVMGYFSLASAREGLDGKEGLVWNAIERANELLPRLESEVVAFQNNQQLLMDKIVDGRKTKVSVESELKSGTAKLQQAQDSHNLQLANEAFQQLRPAINVVVEAYPEMGLEKVQVKLIDETAGSINRISYARGELINAQTSYNQTRVMYPFISGMFPRVNVLGSDSDPSTKVQPSIFETPGQ